MVGSEQERHRSSASSSSSSNNSSPFLALGSGGRPIGSLLNPYDAVVDATRQRCNSSSQASTSTASTPSLRSSACFTDDARSCRSTPSVGPGTSSLSALSAGRRSSAPSLRSQQRESCLAYEEEEVCFIWYHRVDLEKEWVDVRRAFNAQFPTRQRSGFQGIQCRYYRYLYDTWKVPKIRVQKRLGRSAGAGAGGARGENAKTYGLRQWTKREYPWMEEEEGKAGRLSGSVA